ncbi:MAG TPA: MFS transporter, partial [Pirellulales bacterium]|nr:MFS transporter [Pirellulales bacterium]
MPASRRASLLVIFLIVFIDLIGFGIVIPLLPLYAKHFPLEHPGPTIGLLMASFSAMQFLFAPMWGRISDRVGRRPVLLIGLCGSVIFYLLFAAASVADSLALLFVSRIGAGIAGATISTAHAYIADITSLENRTKGMALIGAAFGLGFTLGPMFARLAVDVEGAGLGPGPGYAAAGLSAVALLLAWFQLQE